VDPLLALHGSITIICCPSR